MNAQEQWKRAYRDFRRYAHWKTDFRFSHSVDVMNKVRREAALERKLAAKNREKWEAIDALQSIINEVTNYPGLFDADSESIQKARAFLNAALINKP